MPNVAKYCLAAFLILLGIVFAIRGETTYLILGVIGFIAGLAILFGR